MTVDVTIFEGGPLPTTRLAQIWRSLPERERLPFLLSLDESIGDRLLELTMPGANSAHDTQGAAHRAATGTPANADGRAAQTERTQ